MAAANKFMGTHNSVTPRNDWGGGMSLGGDEAKAHFVQLRF